MQIVWRGTTHVGVALTKTVDSYGYIVTYIVARYSPPGNSDNYSENVAPFIKGNKCQIRKKFDGCKFGIHPVLPLGNKNMHITTKTKPKRCSVAHSVLLRSRPKN